MEKFNGIYSLSKTLRFELVPQGVTLNRLTESGMLEEDGHRAEAYTLVKNLMDDYHRVFIEQTLSRVQEDWDELYDALESYRKDNTSENRGKLELVQAKYRKQLNKRFSSAENYKMMFKADMLTKLLPAMAHTDEQKDALAYFNKFATYFTGFYENRKNMYSAEDISTSIPRRITQENFNRYASNLVALEKIKKQMPGIADEVETTYFTVNGYNKCLNQENIDKYNLTIGEINKQANLYIQQHGEQKLRRKDFMLQPLYKLMLSEKQSLAFVNEIIEKDEQVTVLLNTFFDHVKESSMFHTIKSLFVGVESDCEGIYFTRSALNEISNACFEDWSVISNALKDYADAAFKTKKQKEDYGKRKEISIKELNEILLEQNRPDVFKYFEDAEKKVDAVDALIAAYRLEMQSEGRLKEHKGKKSAVKNVCDGMLDLLHYLKPLAVSEDLERNTVFYSVFDEIYSRLNEFVKIYNRIRNYLTKKSYSEEKFKLNFNCPTLADGWDQSKQQANATIILLKDDKYYLGILNTKNKPKIDDFVDVSLDCDADNVYKKMVYKLLPGPNKMLPKVFFSKKGIEQFNPPQEILDGYEKGKHKKGDVFDLQFCHKLIDFFKEGIVKYPGWDSFDFDFTPTEKYSDISQFYNEVAEQGYKISYEPISDAAVDELVEQGKLFLFQIYNKDFAKGATGTPNLHTLYWKAVFDERNLRDVVFKLNGEAELFYRKKSVEKPFTHKVGSKHVNKRFTDGTPIPDGLYQKIFAWANGLSDTFPKEVEDKKEQVVIKEVAHEIIKDRRFTVDKFFFHVPITINFKAKETYGFNTRANEFIKDAPDVKIIGLDRGERHLIYMSLIDQNGNIIKQQSFNLMGNMDYHKKLDQREHERDAARKSWENIEAIKELKSGYLSQVIHEITKLMVENHAIVVMEDLNFGFKRGRFRIEKQVYQKFEKMLIDKLNYYVDKKADWTEDGGLLKGLQLTNKFVSFERIGKQNGFLYYVPAAYTSKIDPLTGFANIFNFTKLTNFAARKEFFGKFKKIVFESAVDMFAFTFNYDDFDCFQTFKQKLWTVYTNKGRVHAVRERKTGKWTVERMKSLSDNFKEVFEEAEIDYTLDNLQEIIAGLEDNEKNGKFLSKLLFLFKMTLQMRNTDPEQGEDYIVSPVKDKNGEFFDSRYNKETLPNDADGNGAYHIALKGKMLVDRIKDGVDEKNLLKITNEEWFDFVQTRNDE